MAPKQILGIALASLVSVSLTKPIIGRSDEVNTTSVIEKRAWTVPKTPDNPQSGGGVYAWPQKGIDGEDGTNVFLILYCYESVATADKWASVVDGATSKWSSAFKPASGLRIQLHNQCDGDPHVTCDQLVDPGDILIIRDKDTKEGGGSMKSTIGFDYNDSSRENYLHMAGSKTQTTEQNVLSCAHELGHVMGFGHEHQRRDRDTFLEFKCTNLDGIEEAEDMIDEEGDDDPDFEDIDDNKDRLLIVCANYDKAEHYFPEAQDYMKLDHIDPFDAFETDGDLDYNSIMMYSTWQMADDKSDKSDFSLAELYRIDEEGNPVAVWQGGNEDPNLAGPTDRDIARVAYLYPAK